LRYRTVAHTGLQREDRAGNTGEAGGAMFVPMPLTSSSRAVQFEHVYAGLSHTRIIGHPRPASLSLSGSRSFFASWRVTPVGRPAGVCCIGERRGRAGCADALSSSSSTATAVWFRGFRFPPDVILVAVCWYLRYALSYREVEVLLAERGTTVDDVTVYRWMQRFTPLLIDAARPCRHAPGERWFVDETYLKVAGRWVYLYERSTSAGRSSTSWCPRSGIWQPPAGSSPAP
jgi:hypothetical protein